MKESDVAANIGRICRVRTQHGEWEAVLKGRAQNNGHWHVTGPNGKVVAVTAEEILGIKGAEKKVADSEPQRPAADANGLPDESWELPALATFIAGTARRNGLDAWWIGKALRIAQEKHTADRDWLRWLKEDARLSKSTGYRYMDLYDAFNLEQVQDQPLSALYKLMEVREDAGSNEPEEPTEGGDANGPDAPKAGDDKPAGGDSQKPIVAGKPRGRKPSAAKPHVDDYPEIDPEPPAPPPPPVTAAEIDALTEFVEKVGGLARAQYVFDQGIEQLRELAE